MSNCSHCGDDEASLTKSPGGLWVCSECEAWAREADELDLDEYEARRRQRLAEAQEY